MNRPSIDLPRGVRQYDVQAGYAHLVAEGEVLQGLEALFGAAVSHRFLSLTPMGFSCIVPSSFEQAALAGVRDAGLGCTIEAGVVVLRLRSPDLRNQPGALAKVISVLLAEGVAVLHSGDMHDAAYAVVPEVDSERGIAALRRGFGDAA